MIMPLLPTSTLQLLLQPSGVLDVAASPGHGSWAVTFLLLVPLSSILTRILFLWKSKYHFAYGSGSELCSAAWRGRHVAKCSGIYSPAFPWVWSSCFPGNFLRPASTDVLIFHNYGRCQWKLLSSTATAGVMQSAEQGMWHLNKTSCCVTSWIFLTSLKKMEHGYLLLLQIYFIGLKYIHLHPATCLYFAIVLCSGTNTWI